MGESTSQIEHEILAERAELDRNLEELGQRTRQLADWRVHYRNHAAVFLGVAAGAGAVIGAMTAGGHPRRRRVSRPGTLAAGLGSPVAPAADTARRVKQPWRERGPRLREVADTWERASEALLGVAIAKVVDVVSDIIPGFREHYDERRPASARVPGTNIDAGSRPYRDDR